MSREQGLAHLDTYLAQVHRHLRTLSEAEARETLAELRSHVLDRTNGDLSPRAVEEAIAALGSPRDVARLNVTERVASTMEANRSVLGVLRATGRLAGMSLYGLFAFLVSLTGYAFAAGLLIAAVMKPFMPERAGVWYTPGGPNGPDFSIGVVDKAPATQELLGWSIVPIGLLVGCLIGYVTWRFGVFSVRSMRGGARLSAAR